MDAQLTNTMKRILKHLQKKGELAAREITEDLDMNHGTVKQNLYLMNKLGVIEHVGGKGAERGGMGKWKAKSKG